MDGGEFSFNRLEYLTYTYQREEAATELIKLLNHLQTHDGELAPLGDTPSGHVGADRRDGHFATRIASVVTALFSDPNFHVSEEGFLRLIPLQPWLATIFGASPIGNADHIIRIFNQLGYEQASPLTLNDADLLKFCLLYSPDSQIPLEPEILWQKNKRLAAGLFVALLSPRFVATEEAHAKREQLLAWLPPKLREVSLDDLPLPIVVSVWMHCSYAQRTDKHLIKRAINELIRAKLLSVGITDLPAPSPVLRDKPVIMCILEWFHSNHSIYRTHSLSMAALKAKYHVVGISLHGLSDAISRAVFDEVHIFPRGQSPLDTVKQVRELAATLCP